MVLAEQINQIIQSVNKLGLAVRGLYGEGTEALGNVFQVSNQMTLGEVEIDIVERLNKVLLANHRTRGKCPRARCWRRSPRWSINHIGRAYGILANAHSITSKETMNLLSLMRLGMDLGEFPGADRALIDELFVITQPAHLQKQYTEKLSAEERDLLRADMLRERLRNVSRPNPKPARPRRRHAGQTQTKREQIDIMSEEAMNNFTPRAQQVLALARKEADRFNHNFVGTEHLLLGLIKLGQGVAVNVLQKLGLDLETVRMEVEKQVGTGPDQKMIGNIPYTPRVKKVLALAAKEAKALNHTYVGTEHILLGLLREGDGVAARVLKNLDVDIEQTRQEILKELDPNFAAPDEPPGRRTGRSPPRRKPREKRRSQDPRPQGLRPRPDRNRPQRRNGPRHRPQKRNRARHPDSLPPHQEQSRCCSAKPAWARPPSSKVWPRKSPGATSRRFCATSASSPSTSP